MNIKQWHTKFLSKLKKDGIKTDAMPTDVGASMLYVHQLALLQHGRETGHYGEGSRVKLDDELIELLENPPVQDFEPPEEVIY